MASEPGIADRHAHSDEGAPYVRAEASEELLTIKHAALFVCTRQDGAIVTPLAGGEGFYAGDTRHLSELCIKLGGRPPVLLSSTDDAVYEAVVDATNCELEEDGKVRVPQQTVAIQQHMLLSERLHCVFELHNFGPVVVDTELELMLAADFADIFEVRGAARREGRAAPDPVAVSAQGCRFSHIGEDNLTMSTTIEVSPAPARIDEDGGRVRIGWPVRLEPRERMTLSLTAAPEVEGELPRRSFPDAERAVQAEHDAWTRSCTRIESANEIANKVLAASERDLRALMTPIELESGPAQIVAAGIPWYVAPFGRDSLLTSYECLVLNPEMARQTLHALAALQAKEDDPWRDAEPGKILHELRVGELARAGLLPHSPYYGTVDATPLFLMLAAALFRWTGDEETLARLKPSLDAALDWIDNHGDLDGDGFLEYHRRSPQGLRNQGWKDSEDCIVHADGSLAEGPIALAEVQGYAYMAKLRIAEVYEALGEPDRARSLRAEADTLRLAFDQAFWDDEIGFHVLALDGEKRQVRSVTTNPGHCLYTGIVEDRRAAAMAERLLAPDMFSGWGIRTLSSESPAYNPMSYHNGSVWPHDNAIVAAGLKRYGFEQAAERVACALFEAAGLRRDHRLQELWCGFERRGDQPPVAYPVACNPQAWAAAAPFMLVQTLLGISPRDRGSALTVNAPRVPDWLGHVRIGGLRVGGSLVEMSFHREGDATAFSLLGQSGEIEVTMSG